MRLLKHEQQLRNEGFNVICGIDEVGCGALAGNLVACAVVIDIGKAKQIRIGRFRINDSKLLPKEIRKKLYPRILRASFAVGIGVVDVHEINYIKNMRKSGYIARHRAVQNLGRSNPTHCHIYWHPKDQSIAYAKKFSIPYTAITPHYILLDGPFGMPEIKGIPVRSLVGGDRESISIASASIIAKVFRDEQMINISKLYPKYGFERNVGYATGYHQQAIKKYGISPYHRLYFNGVREIIDETSKELDEQANSVEIAVAEKDQLKFEFTN